MYPQKINYVKQKKDLAYDAWTHRQDKDYNKF